MALEYRGNVITPLNTLGLTVKISEINPRAHTTILGNDDARPSRMLKAMVEYDMKNGRKVIAVGFNSSYAGLATGEITVIDLTRANATFHLNASNADILAALIIASPHSFAIDVGGLEPGPAARVVERIAACLSIQDRLVMPTTLAIDLTDVLTPKRRMGLDADAVQQLNSLLGRGFDLGVRLIMAANAPSEIPLEFERGTMQSIVSRVTGNAIRSVGKHVDQEELIYKHADRPGIGIADTDQGDYWLFPMTADPYGPYLIIVPELETKVGDRDQSGRKVTPATRSFCEKYQADVAAAEDAKEKAEIERQVEEKLRKKRIADIVDARVSLVHPARNDSRNRKINVAAKTTEKPNITNKQIVDLLDVAGVDGRPACRASCVMALAMMNNEPLEIAAAVALAKSDQIGAAVRIGESFYKVGMLRKGIAFAVTYGLILEDADQVEAFRVRLMEGNTNDIVGAVGYKLRNSPRTPLDAESRQRMLTKAWRDHLTGAMPKADNDDVGLARAA